MSAVLVTGLIVYLEMSALLPRLQSAYGTGHALVGDWGCRAQTAVRYSSGIDDGDLSALVLIDLSAAFDTVDHHILLYHV